MPQTHLNYKYDLVLFCISLKSPLVFTYRRQNKLFQMTKELPGKSLPFNSTKHL